MSEKRYAGLVRKDFYAYLEKEGLKITDQRHTKIRAFIKEHSFYDNEFLNHAAENARNALSCVSIPAKSTTIVDRIKTFRCPVCGLDMKKGEDDLYETACGHLPKILFSKRKERPKQPKVEFDSPI